jgi:hypothetical protein
MQSVHRQCSVECFNECWKYIEMPERSDEDIENMVLLAYASLWHWKRREDCQPVNLSTGYWQLSRVHALAGHGEQARLFGERCLDVGEANALDPFYVGYAHEALARAELTRGNAPVASGHLALARTWLTDVFDPEEIGLLMADLDELANRLPTTPAS